MKKPLSEEQKKRRAEYARKWRAEHPEATREHSKRSRQKNKEKIRKSNSRWREENYEALLQRSKDWYQANKDRVRNNQLKLHFGITIEQYNDMLTAQNGVCKLCGGPPGAKSKRYAVDHDHLTGKVRSLLCRGCNVGIGNLKDDPELLEKAALYIKEYRKETE